MGARVVVHLNTPIAEMKKIASKLQTVQNLLSLEKIKPSLSDKDIWLSSGLHIYIWG